MMTTLVTLYQGRSANERERMSDVSITYYSALIER